MGVYCIGPRSPQLGLRISKPKLSSDSELCQNAYNFEMDRAREQACVCEKERERVCVCVRERERERARAKRVKAGPGNY